MTWIKLLIAGMATHLGLFSILLNQRGEVGDRDGGGDKGGEGDKGGGTSEKTFTQKQLNDLIAIEKGRFQEKYGDYEDLKKFKQEHERKLEQQKQQDLEAQQKYDELKKGWQQKEENYNKALQEKEQKISDLNISYQLNSVLSKLNAYPEAAAAVKGSIQIDDNGQPKMSGKDSVGNETLVDLEEGVKNFLKDRPYLVRGANRSGSDTPPSGGGGTGQGQDTLDDLNRRLQTETSPAKRKELTAKIREVMSSRGINRFA